MHTHDFEAQNGSGLGAATKEVADRAKRYAKSPWHSAPGKHEIYHLVLSELIKIMGDNVKEFTPVIPTARAFIGGLELLRLPHAVSAHGPLDRG